MEAKVVVNKSYGGFELTAKALKELGKLKFPEDVEFLDKIPEEYFSDGNDWLGYKDESERLKFESIKDVLSSFEDGRCNRADKDLAKVVESLGEEAEGELSCLEVEAVSSLSGQYYIDEYDGNERVFSAENMVFDKMYKEPEIHDKLGEEELNIMLAAAFAIGDLKNRITLIEDRYSEMFKMRKENYDKDKFEGAYLAIKNSLNNVKSFDMQISEAKEILDKRTAMKDVHKSQMAEMKKELSAMLDKAEEKPNDIEMMSLKSRASEALEKIRNKEALKQRKKEDVEREKAKLSKLF